MSGDMHFPTVNLASYRLVIVYTFQMQIAIRCLVYVRRKQLMVDHLFYVYM